MGCLKWLRLTFQLEGIAFSCIYFVYEKKKDNLPNKNMQK